MPLALAGCFTDAATRLAYDIEAAAARVRAAEGGRRTHVHRTPSKRGQCAGRHIAQLDRVGTIPFWCKHVGGGRTVSGQATSCHARFVDTPQTGVLDTPAREPLTLELERRGGRVTVAAVQ